MITSNIISRVLFISVNEDTGSCFSFEHQNEQYLVTAKHVLDSIDFVHGDKIQIKIYCDKKWNLLDCIIYIHQNSEIDIAVLKAQIKFPALSVDVGIDGLIYGGDVYFLGFPYGMFNVTKDEKLKFPIPFVKKGILSAIVHKYDITSLYIDAHNNRGFSGGPIITTNNKGEIKIVGVNISYLKHENIIDVEEQDDDGYLFEKQLEYYENSGIMEAQSIHHVQQIIEAIDK